MVLSMGVLVVSAILPLVPTYIDNHLNRLFNIFCDLATIKNSCRLGQCSELCTSDNSYTSTIQLEYNVVVWKLMGGGMAAVTTLLSVE